MSDETVQLQGTGPIDLPKFDATKYIGKQTTIISVTEHKGQFGYYVKFTSDKLDPENDVRASKIIGLQTTEVKDEAGNVVKDENGQPKVKVGWGQDTKMATFLAKHGISHYQEMIGRQVIVQTRTSKDGTDFLTF